jgi:sodium/hydrogen antiporter
VLDVYLATVGGLALLVGLASRPLHELPLSEPLLALLLGVALGPVVLDAVALPGGERDAILATASQVVVAISVMAVALRFPLAEVRQRLGGLALLITVVLLGMAAISAGLSSLFLGLPLGAAWLLGAALAPTDPVVSSSIIAGDAAERDLPLHLRVLVSVESAANDGLGFALVLVGIVVLGGGTVWSGATSAGAQAALGVVLGTAVGLAAGWLVNWADRHRDIEHAAFLALTLSLTALVLGLAGLVGAEPILAVFVAGLAYNRELTRVERAEEWEVQEAINNVLVLPAFTLLGVALPWALWVDLGWRGPAFAAAILLARRVPLLLACARPLGLSVTEAVFAGWFGPIGVAALLYIAQAGERGVVTETVWAAGSLTIVISIIVHGISAAPGRKALARHLTPDEP